MRRRYRITIVMFVSMCFCLIAAGCGKKSKAPEPVPSELSEYANEVVVKINQTEIDYREAMLYLQAARQEYETSYGQDVWSYVIGADQTTVGEQVKERTLSQMIYQKVITAEAKRLGIELDSEEKKAVTERVEAYMQMAQYAALAKYGIARKDVERIYTDTAITQKLYDTVTLNVDTDISNEEAEQKHLQSLVLHNYKVSETGERSRLSVSELLVTLDRFDRLYAEAETTDFYSLAYQNTDDKQYLDVWVGKGDLPEELSAAYDLRTGKAMQIRTEEGYYLFYCVTDFDEEAMIAKKEQLIAKRQEDEFRKLYEARLAEAKVTLNDEVWQSICEELRQ